MGNAVKKESYFLIGWLTSLRRKVTFEDVKEQRFPTLLPVSAVFAEIYSLQIF